MLSQILHDIASFAPEENLKQFIRLEQIFDAFTYTDHEPHVEQAAIGEELTGTDILDNLRLAYEQHATELLALHGILLSKDYVAPFQFLIQLLSMLESINAEDATDLLETIEPGDLGPVEDLVSIAELFDDLDTTLIRNCVSDVDPALIRLILQPATEDYDDPIDQEAVDRFRTYINQRQDTITQVAETDEALLASMGAMLDPEATPALTPHSKSGHGIVCDYILLKGSLPITFEYFFRFIKPMLMVYEHTPEGLPDELTTLAVATNPKTKSEIDNMLLTFEESFPAELWMKISTQTRTQLLDLVPHE